MAETFVPWFCGLPCVPMTLEQRPGGGLSVTAGGCPVCREEVGLFRGDAGPARVEGCEASADEAIDAAARILREAGAPFVHGLSRSSGAAARRAATLAALLRGTIDVEDGTAVEPDLAALAAFGLPSATFGEIRERADVVLLWRCDPRSTHPRLFERAERGAARPPRLVVLVPPRGSAGAAADLVLTVDDGGDLDAALALRALLNGAAIDGRNHRVGGISLDTLGAAADLLRRARYSAIVWDGAATAGADGFAMASTLTLMARDLNRASRSAARPLGAGGNVAGAFAVLASTTGYPRAVGFAGGVPRYAPGELDAARMIGEGRADVLLLVGARSFGGEGRGAPGRPERSPIKDDTTAGDPAGVGDEGREPPRLIVVGPRLPRGAGEPAVFIPTSTPGISAAGLATRADGVTVVMKALVASRLPAEEEVLEALAQRLDEREGSPSPAARRG